MLKVLAFLKELITVLPDIINVIENLVGKDLDGDGDVGEPG